jgi:hypothetical protein
MKKIETREELINALMDAAELEHNLACLYLFAAFTIKDREDELDLAELNLAGATAEEQKKGKAKVLTEITGWREQIVDIALQEMGHLGSVSNLLTLVGAEPHFDRPNFPPQENYYPPSAKFHLERFGDDALDRFVEFERNALSPGTAELGIAPRGLKYQHVGELYAALVEAFEPAAAKGIPLADDDLFLGYQKALDKGWTSRVKVHDFDLNKDVPPPTKDLRDKIRVALNDIMVEGEGSPEHPEGSHYDRFFKIQEGRRKLKNNYPNFDPARDVSRNPMTQFHRGAIADLAVVNIIKAPLTKDVAELFNSVYATMLIALRQYFSFHENLGGAVRRSAMRRVPLRLMRETVEPLGKLLTLLPMKDDGSGQKAGPGFELYRPLYVAAKPEIAWCVVRERLQIAHDEANRLKNQTFPAKDMNTILDDVATAAASIADQVRKNLVP